MKKSIIAASASAVALAAMPVLGAFADVTDTVQVTITQSCTVASDTNTSDPGAANATFSANVANGATKTWAAASGTGGSLYISCNDASGWNVKAQGYSNDTAGTTTMVTTGSGTPIATGTTFSGATSAWAFKLADDGTGATIVADDWTAVPASATLVASKSGTVSQGHIFTGYQVYVSPTQVEGTYIGKVKYTVAAGLGS
ncbi:hypothetical protein IKF92_00270 [Candidatus Saccharibacteria bacterium]|nr:hypothetical protein [Candidatus Saccharibacteria bacterium]